MNKPSLDVHLGDNLEVIRDFPSAIFGLIYIDPPFNTGKTQRAQGKRAAQAGMAQFSDTFEDLIEFLGPRLQEAHRLLSPSGSLFVHLDYREVHYCKVLLDGLFGRECFINEIIWAYDYGARAKKRWSAKHDNILWYVKDPKNYVFNFDEMDRIPYMAPGLVGKEKAERGKTPTDVWWHTIVPTNGKERTGYPTQKPVGILNRVIKVHSKPGDRVLDFFAGSGTTGESAYNLGRSCVLVDNNPQAVKVMIKRLCSLGAEPFNHSEQEKAKGR